MTPDETLYPCSFVVFGATGNLATIKLLPALYRLEAANRLPEVTSFIAFGRRAWGDDQWRAHMEQALKDRLGKDLDPEVYAKLAARFSFVQGDLNEVEGYRRLLDELGKPKAGVCSNIIFYLSLKPADYGVVVKNLAQVGLNQPRGWHRIVIEKPFGEDLESARTLNQLLHRHYEERQIFRIDHYLGKETVQNLLVLRFANLLIEPLWNRNYIDHIQFTVAEDIGIENRADYYDRAGALRDMLQNHLMQLLALVAMEPPPVLEAEALRDEKVKVLRSIRPISRRAVSAQAFRAQYAKGNTNGTASRGYQEEAGVEPGSVTETFAAIKLYIDNWRWRGVPFYLRTGKRLAQSMSLIAVRFRDPPQQLFRETPIQNPAPNWMLLSIQPHESIQLEIHAKQPGFGMSTHVLKMDASYRRSPDTSTDAYEALLLDVIRGDASLFIRFDEVEWAWRVVDPILQCWAQERDFIATYPAGSWGPEEASRLFEADEQHWRNEL